ncbi:hypothetical protein QJQ45_016034 [Haematococcus lacustris]|nr:hypothetical protein QJQ45_016034 [Haematococcus lacustris]
MGISNKKAKPDEDSAPDAYVHQCQDVIRFRLVEGGTPADMAAEISQGGVEFDGEFFHQHFGDEENIKGYKHLSIDIWISAQTYHTWIDIKYKQKKLGADKIDKVLRKHFPSGYASSKDEFIKLVTSTVQGASTASASDKLDVQAAGDTLGTVALAGTSQVLIKRFTLASSPTRLQELHARIEPLLLFFIDGASLIEKGDDKWDILLAVQPSPKGNLVLGLASMYSFWAYPESQRLRLSQILVLPPYRDVGLGKAMLHATYGLAKTKGCFDLTVEDPTPNLQRVREKLEVEALQATAWVRDQARKCVEFATTSSSSAAAWPWAADMEASSDPSDGTGAGAGVESKGQQGSGEGQPGPGRNPLQPPAAFLAKVRAELKIYINEVRLAWEALLFLQPGLWKSDSGKALLVQLLAARLEAAAFATVATDAERKRLVKMKGDERNFIMMRAVPGAAGGMAVAEPPPPLPADSAAGSSQAGCEGGEGSGPTGRGLSVSSLTPEQKAARLAELVEERVEQLLTLQRLMGKGNGTDCQGKKRSKAA